MSDTNGSLDPKPWWRTRRAHSAPGPGGRVLLYCKDLSIHSPVTGAHLLDQVTLGFRSGSFTAILDPSGSRTRAFFFAVAGLHPPSSGSITLSSSGSKDRTASVGLLSASTPLDGALSVAENILAPLSLTGTSALAPHVQQALTLTSLEELAEVPASELSPLDRFRTLSARALVCGGDLILAEEPSYLPSASDRQAALELLRVLAQQGATVILGAAFPQSCTCADRTILLTNGRVTADVLSPTLDRLYEIMACSADDPATLSGSCPVLLDSAVALSIDEGGAADTKQPEFHNSSLDETSASFYADTPPSLSTDSHGRDTAPSALAGTHTPADASEAPLDVDAARIEPVKLPWIPIRRSTEPTPHPPAPVVEPPIELTDTPDVSDTTSVCAHRTESSGTTPDGAASTLSTFLEPAWRPHGLSDTATPAAASAPRSIPPLRPVRLSAAPSQPTLPPRDTARPSASVEPRPGPALATPIPEPPQRERIRTDEPDPITAAIRALVTEERSAQTRGHQTHSSSAAQPSPQTRAHSDVIDRAQKILGDLPGSVIPASETPTHGARMRRPLPEGRETRARRTRT